MTYEPLTPAQAEARMRACAHRLLEAIDEHGIAAEEEAAAIAEYERVYLTAHLTSLTSFPERKVGHHETAARDAAMDLRDKVLHATAKRRALAEEMHSLRQVLSSIQTNARAMQGVS